MARHTNGTTPLKSGVMKLFAQVHFRDVTISDEERETLKERIDGYLEEALTDEEQQALKRLQLEAEKITHE